MSVTKQRGHSVLAGNQTAGRRPEPRLFGPDTTFAQTLVRLLKGGSRDHAYPSTVKLRSSCTVPVPRRPPRREPRQVVAASVPAERWVQGGTSHECSLHRDDHFKTVALKLKRCNHEPRNIGSQQIFTVAKVRKRGRVYDSMPCWAKTTCAPSSTSTCARG